MNSYVRGRRPHPIDVRLLNPASATTLVTYSTMPT
jgi:hypothetical protein